LRGKEPSLHFILPHHRKLSEPLAQKIFTHVVRETHKNMLLAALVTKFEISRFPFRDEGASFRKAMTQCVMALRLLEFDECLPQKPFLSLS